MLLMWYENNLARVEQINKEKVDNILISLFELSYSAHNKVFIYSYLPFQVKQS